MTQRLFLRIVLATMPLLVLTASSGADQRPSDLPPAPEPINGVPVQALKDLPCSSVTLSEDGKTILTSGTGALRTLDLATGKEIQRFEDPLFKRWITPTPDGKLWVQWDSYAPDNPTDRSQKWYVWLIDPAMHRVVRKLEHHTELAHWIGFSADSKQMFATENNTGKVVVWDLASGRILRKTPFDGIEGVSVLLPAPDGSAYAVCPEGRLRVIDARTGRERWRLQLTPENGYSDRGRLAFSPDSRLLAAAQRYDNRIDLFDMATGTVVQRIEWRPDLVIQEARGWVSVPGRPAGVFQVMFSPDGRALLAGCCDHRVAIFEVATGKMRHRFEGPVGELIPLQRGFQFVAVHSRPEQTEDVVVWDWFNPARATEKATAAQLRQAVVRLDRSDAANAGQAMRLLANNPDQAVAVLGAVLKPVHSADERSIAGLVRALDDDDFEARERAEQRLKDFNSAARAALEVAVKADVSREAHNRVRRLLDALDDKADPGRLRVGRGIEVLEYVATPSALALLKSLAEGAPGATATEEARAALRRLDR